MMIAINKAISNTVNMTLVFNYFFNCLIAFGETITFLLTAFDSSIPGIVWKGTCISSARYAAKNMPFS